MVGAGQSEVGSAGHRSRLRAGLQLHRGGLSPFAQRNCGAGDDVTDSADAGSIGCRGARGLCRSRRLL